MDCLEDSWGYDTGVKAAYEQTYGNARQEIGTVSTSDQNLGNNFKEFERMHTAILNMQIRDMLINLFEYENAPETLNTAQLEIMLRSFGGGVCVGKDYLGDLVILGRADELAFNYYGNVMPSIFDNQNEFLTNKKVITNRNLEGDFVVFYNKQSYLDFYSTDFAIVSHYAKLLATTKATERMNILQMRSPFFVKSPKNSMSGQIIQQKIMSGELFIDFDSDAEILDRMGKVDFNIPDRTSSLQQAYRNTFNELLTLFGVYNNPELKKERLTTGESSANNHIIEGMGDIYLNARRNAVELINLAFGTDIKVKWNSAVAEKMRNLNLK